MDPTAYKELKAQADERRDLKTLGEGLFKYDDNDKKWKRVICKPDHEEIIRALHEGRAAGHLGKRITIKKIQDRYWWPKMTQAVEKFLSTCDPCQREKKPKKAKDIYPIIATRPFQIVGIDHVGPLHTAEGGYAYLIVAQDYFTKWPMARPTRTTNTDEALEFLINDICAQHGVPEQIITDQGTAFTSEKWKRTVKAWGIRHTPTTPANPQANGQVERFNQTLIKMLRKTLGVHKGKWTRFLPEALMAYRTSVQATTEHTPSQLVYGRQMRLPIDAAYPVPINELLNQPVDRIKQLEALEPTRLEVAERIKEKQAKVKAKMEANKGPATPLQVGDKVLLYAPQHKRKLEQNCEGPFRIRAIGRGGSYVLENMYGGLYKSVGRRRLIKYNDRNEARVELGEPSVPLI